jgi:hypothetical protein
METLRDGIGKLRQALSDRGLDARDRTRFEKFTTALTAQPSELDATEEEWLALELLQEYTKVATSAAARRSSAGRKAEPGSLPPDGGSVTERTARSGRLM